MNKQSISRIGYGTATVLSLTLLLIIGVFVGNQPTFAQESTPEATADSHHPASEVTPVVEPMQAGMMGMMENMRSMMDMMMGMEMSDEMRTQMTAMSTMMGMMENMRGMMDMMMGMEMSDEMRTQMTAMSAMMGMSMNNTTPTPQPMDGMEMEMNTGYSVDDLAPLALAYYQGTDVYFIHPEASDAGVAEVLTNMMGTDVITVPSLADIPDELLGNVYVFTNGIEAMGPLGFQPDVFDSIPSDANYTPLRAINFVTWQETVEPRELKSADDILTASANGEIVIERVDVVVNMPILVWGEQHR